MKKSKFVLIVIAFLHFSSKCIAQNKSKLCQDTLKSEHSINRVSATFLNSVCAYKSSEFTVVNRKCTQPIINPTFPTPKLANSIYYTCRLKGL